MQPSASATAFRRLHDTEDVLVLPNAWDVASALLIEQAGARAIATTSAGIAWSLGAADGEKLARELALPALQRIVAAVDIPVSADIESGYATTLSGLADTIDRVVATGAAGLNLEDATGGRLRPLAEQSARIAAARTAADRAGGLFVNARIDTYLTPDTPAGERLAATIARATAYVSAGADGIFVPGLVHENEIAEIAQALDAPLNVMVADGSPTISRLRSLGVRRVSTGMAIAQAAYATVARAAHELLTAGSYGTLVGGVEYDAMNALMARH
jgi:2-methylisocitrate lyase-like PEP mutase family enzyme